MTNLRATLVRLAWLTLCALASTAHGAYVGEYIQGVVPTKAGTGAAVTLNVLGRFPDNIASVSLWSQTAAEIPGEIVAIERGGFERSWADPLDVIRVRFDLSAADPGLYDVSVAYDGGTQVIYSYQEVTVAEEQQPELWAEISGSTTVRAGSETTYLIWYGNMGNVDLPSGLLMIGIPKTLNYTLGFNLDDYKLAPIPELSPAGDPNAYEVPIDQEQYEILQLSIRQVPIQSLQPLKITIRWGTNPSDHILKAWWAGGKPEGYHPIWPEH